MKNCFTILFLGLALAAAPLNAAPVASRGENALKNVLSAMFNQHSLSAHVDASSKGGKVKSGAPRKGSAEIAVDWRKPSTPRHKIALHIPREDNVTVNLTVAVIGDWAYLSMIVPGRGMMAYKLNTEKMAKTRAGQGAQPGLFGRSSGLHEGVGNRRAAKHESLSDFFRACEKEGKDPVDLMVAKVKSHSRIIHIKPNIVKLLATDGRKGSLKLYYDKNTSLPKTVIAVGGDGNVITLRFSKWRRGGDVNTSLPLAAAEYKDFSAESLGRMISAFTGSAPPASTTMQKHFPGQPRGGEGFPTGFPNGFPNGLGRGDTNGSGLPSGFPASAFGGNGSGASSKDDGKKAAEAVKKMFDTFNSPEFKRKMMEAQKKAAEAMKRMQSPEFQKQMEAARKAQEEMMKQFGEKDGRPAGQ